MKELEAIERQVEVATLNMGERVARIYDALHALHDLTLATLSMTPRDATQVDAWFELAGFAIDAHGYYERADVLARARAGESDRDTQTYYANEARSRDPEARYRMYAMRGLPRVVRGITERLDGLAWVYYQDATGFAMTYPMHDPCTVVPADFDWHAYFTYESVKPSVNPEREIRWTAPNIDYGGKGLMVSVSIPLYVEDTLHGVWSFDLPVRSLAHESLVSAKGDEQSVFIVDREGLLIVHDTMETIAATEGGAEHREPVSSLGGDLATLDVPALLEEGSGHLELVDGDGRSLYAVYRRVDPLDWVLVVTVPTQGVVARLRALFDASPVGIALVGTDGRVQEVNGELARILGMPARALIDRALESIASPELRPQLGTLIGATFAEQGDEDAAESADGELLGAADERIPVRVVARPFVSGGERSVLVAFEDMSERRRLQAQVLQTQKMQAIGRLAGGVAHDFNNLLTAILGSSTLLRMRAPEPFHELIDSITFAGERAAALTGQLLAFSRRQVVQPRHLSLPDLVRGLEDLLARLLEEDVELHVQADMDVPAIRADPGQIEQVVMNLVLNARDALPRGGRIEVRVSRCTSSRGADAACLSVIDDGVGMDEQTRARLFEPFFTTKQNGTGLGLATVDDIVRASGGVIRVKSALDAGTTIHVELPATRMQPEVESALPRARRPEAHGVILVVDDEPLVRDTARRVLEQEGYGVELAANGEEALDRLEAMRDEIALVLTDVVMPGTGGRKLAERIADRFTGLPVLLMTGYTDDQILRQGIESSDVPLVRKPFTPDALLRAVGRALRR